jgi:hypothetical protein
VFVRAWRGPSGFGGESVLNLLHRVAITASSRIAAGHPSCAGFGWPGDADPKEDLMESAADPPT